MSGALLALPLLASSDSARNGRPDPMNDAKFEAFYRATAPKLWSYLYRLTSDPAAADDLLQKAYFRFIRANAVFVSDEHMRRFIYRTATNLAFDHFREAKRERNREIVVPPVSISQESAELRHDMMRVFGELKPQERALLWLAHVEGSDHEEIGEALGVKTKSVKVLLFRARKKLGELLSKKGLAPEVSR
jgi:RNA polymerase sigma-70 factor (ECF subfamily)